MKMTPEKLKRRRELNAICAARYRQKGGKEYAERHRTHEARYRAQNPSRGREWRKKYRTMRMATDPTFRIVASLRSRLVIALKGIPKAAASMRLLGCTADFFRAYVEARFKQGMSWQNYGLGVGRWHLDHIVPCAKFDLLKAEDQRACFHYSNLQPMWGHLNQRKGAKAPSVHQKELL